LWNTYSLDAIKNTVSGMIVPELKVLLAADLRPTVDETRTLPRVTSKDTGPGVYYGLLEARCLALYWQYIEFARRTSWKDIYSRTSDHSRPGHRGELRAPLKSSYLYKLMDDPSEKRTFVFYKLAIGAYASCDVTDVEFMRMCCFITETALMGLVQTYKHAENKCQP
jgi:hypothetical protein